CMAQLKASQTQSAFDRRWAFTGCCVVARSTWRATTPGAAPGQGAEGAVRTPTRKGAGSLKSPPRSAFRTPALSPFAVAALAGPFDLGPGRPQRGADLVGLEIGRAHV